MRMCDDEDLYVVIIGEEDNVIKHEPISIKHEVLDEEDLRQTVEDLLVKAEKNGEIFKLDSSDSDISRIQDEHIKVEVKTEVEDEYDLSYEDNAEYLHEYEDFVNCVDDSSEKLKKDTKSNDDGCDEFDEEYLPDDGEIVESDHYVSDSSEKPKRKGSKLKRKCESYIDDVVNNPKELPRRKMLSSKERQSFVKELKQNYPELRDNKELLINCLVEVMKTIKPPPPPDDYFVMKDISFKCVLCGALTETVPAAGRHYQEKHGKRYLFCFACGVDFRSKTNLYKHEKRCDSPDAVIVLKARAIFLGRKGRSRPFIPNEAYFTSKKEQSAARFQCSECSASFCSRTGLQAHEHLHRGERPFLCPHCPCAYTSQTTLTRHLHKHGDQKYICEHCSKEFKMKPALVLHMNTHEPLKKFPCSQCSKRYSQKAALVLHVNRDHLRLPLPFGCKLCPKRYPRMSVLKEHMKKVHGMVIMTRKMFFKKLPMLTDTQLQQAKVILKSELDDTSAAVVLGHEGQLLRHDDKILGHDG